MKMIILWALSIILGIDSILRAFRTNFNLGTFLMYAITVCVWLYTIFNKQIDAFTSHGIGLIIKWIFIAGVIFALALVMFLIIAGYSNTASGDEEVIIVLGAGLRGEKVSAVLQRRLDAAHDFYLENTDITIVVTGGQGPGEDIPEALAMQRYLVDKGVPKEQIIMEDKSTSTQENFLFAMQLLKEAGFSESTKIAFSTNHFHSYRSYRYALDAGFENVSSVPAPTGLNSVMPSYLREIFAVLYYWVFV